MKTLKLVTGPAYEPVSVAQAKEWLLISDDTSHDNTIAKLVKAMREHAENLTHRAFVQRSYTLYMDAWPYDAEWGIRIDLPFPPLRSVTSLKYTDTGGTLQTMDAADYSVQSAYEPAFIIPAYGEIWPSIRKWPDSIQVAFVAGYDPGSPQDQQGYRDAMPGALLTWMEARIATLFENREQIITGTIVAALPRDHADGMLDDLVIGTRLF
jgi:uncharacterized phiE125 gp8 family phage protein